MEQLIANHLDAILAALVPTIAVAYLNYRGKLKTITHGNRDEFEKSLMDRLKETEGRLSRQLLDHLDQIETLKKHHAKEVEANRARMTVVEERNTELEARSLRVEQRAYRCQHDCANLRRHLNMMILKMDAMGQKVDDHVREAVKVSAANGS